MKNAPAITCLFLDIGGVLLNDGWDHHARRRAAKQFKLNWAELEQRHIENTPMFVQIAEGMGIRGILHTDYQSTRAKLGSFGLQPGE